MIRVLFVCLGNICRSPMAEGLFNEKIRRLGLQESFHIDSAGTGNYHIGAQPDHRTLETLQSHGISHSHVARQVKSTDNKHFDYILAMDRQNLYDLQELLGDDVEGMHLMRSFDKTDTETDVPDPYYGGQRGFEEVFEVLDRSLDGFIEFLRTRHKL